MSERINTVNLSHHNNMKTIVLTGGGTAGHVMPNLALVPELEKHFSKIVYIGTNGIEKQLAKSANLEFKEIEAVKFVRSLSPKNLLIPAKLFRSISQAKKILKEINPSVVFSKGGYVSIPVAIAAKKLGIPVLTHESDLSLGLANKIISHYATLTLTAFEKTAKGKKRFVFSGSPVRNQIFKGDKSKIKANLSRNKKTVLFFGGSLGAKAINETVFSCLGILTKKYNVLHITGKGKKKELNFPNYFAVEYTNEIENFFNAADYVVCRAGANSVFELLALCKPMLLIPLPKAESRGDQIDNAKYFKEKGMCEVLFQENLNCENLIKSLKNLENNSKIIQKNIKKQEIKSPNKKIVEIIVENSK